MTCIHLSSPSSLSHYSGPLSPTTLPSSSLFPTSVPRPRPQARLLLLPPLFDRSLLTKVLGSLPPSQTRPLRGPPVHLPDLGRSPTPSPNGSVSKLGFSPETPLSSPRLQNLHQRNVSLTPASTGSPYLLVNNNLFPYSFLLHRSTQEVLEERTG